MIERTPDPDVPRPAPRRRRFTVARLMVVAALTACLLGLFVAMRSRSRDFRARANLHLATATYLIRLHHPPSPFRVWARITHHTHRYVEYKRAASYPWLPEPSESPEPTARPGRLPLGPTGEGAIR